MQPFVDLPYIPRSPSEIIEVAFRRGNKKASSIKIKGSPIEKAKAKEIARIKTIRNYVRRRLRDICFGYPRLDELHPFL